MGFTPSDKKKEIERLRAEYAGNQTGFTNYLLTVLIHELLDFSEYIKGRDNDSNSGSHKPHQHNGNRNIKTGNK